MPKAIADTPGSRSNWQWEKLKAHLEEEYYNPAKFDANCKVTAIILMLNSPTAIQERSARSGQPLQCYLP
jgi:predicted DNA binding CopG/RHH family protein